MKASDFTVSESERKAAADALVQTETTNSVNSGIAQSANRSASLSSNTIKKAASAALSGSEVEGLDQTVYGAYRVGKESVRGAKASYRAIRHIKDGTGREMLKRHFSLGNIKKKAAEQLKTGAKTGVKSGITGALKDSEVEGLDTEVKAAYKGTKKTLRAAKQGTSAVRNTMLKMQSRRNQAVSMQKAAEAKAAASAGAAKGAAANGAAAGAAAAKGGGGLAAAGAGGCLLPLVGGFLVLILFCALLSAILGGSNSTQNYSLSEVEIKVAQFFREKGLDDIQIAAIMGNMYAESGMNPAKVQEDGGGRGICQWDGGRRDHLFSYAAMMQMDWTNLDLQLKFFWEEDEWKNNWSGSYTVSGGYSNPSPPPGTHVSGSKDGFLSASTVAEATEQFCYGWERAGFPRIDGRIAKAEEYYAALQSGLGSDNYVNAAIAIANDDTHGYSQTTADGGSGRTLNPDVDCSSLVYYALLNSGYTKDQIGGYPFATGSMPDILPKAGFVRHDFTSVDDLQPGDILLRSGHTEIYIGNGKNVGAHWNRDGKPGDSSGKEVNIQNCGTNWTWYYRKG